MAGNIKAKARKVEELFRRTQALLQDFESLRPKNYGGAPTPDDCMTALAWKWSRFSLFQVHVDLGFLLTMLQWKIVSRESGSDAKGWHAEYCEAAAELPPDNFRNYMIGMIEWMEFLIRVRQLISGENMTPADAWDKAQAETQAAHDEKFGGADQSIEFEGAETAGEGDDVSDVDEYDDCEFEATS
jgi:hypothetical protein